MRRRDFISLLGYAASAWPFIARAQEPAKIYRVALIVTTSPISSMVGSDPINPAVRAFVQGLRAAGYVEGQNLIFMRRSAEGKSERFGSILAELVSQRADVIVTTGDVMALEAKRVAKGVPIVMASSNDPVGIGAVTSLARPGGNITGFTVAAGPETEAKRLELLKELVPKTAKVAVLQLQRDWRGPDGNAIRAAAGALRVTLMHAEQTPRHYRNAFDFITRNRPDALFVARSPTSYADRRVIVDFAVEQRLPGTYPHREFSDAGGLMSYGVNIPDLFRRAAGTVDKILKGAKPADLPVEQPTKFELVINLKTATALGLAAPPALIARADEVIE